MSGDGGDKWISRGNRRELCRTGVMTMVSETFECARTGAVHDFITVDLIDWVVVVAETPEKELVMIRQFRHGSGRIELEVPGGCIDRKDSDPLEAAERELALFPYENEKTQSLRACLSAGGYQSVSIMTGPEGGFSEDEVAFAGQNGMKICSLGPRILRCETAPLCALTAVLYAAGALD